MPRKPAGETPTLTCAGHAPHTRAKTGQRKLRKPSWSEFVRLADQAEPVSLTIYTSAEPSRTCSPPASPVRPKATGRVQLLLE